MKQVRPSDLQPPALAIEELCSIVRRYVPGVDAAGSQTRDLQIRMHDDAQSLDCPSLTAALEELCAIVRAYVPAVDQAGTQCHDLQNRCNVAANSDQIIRVQWLAAQIEELCSIVRAHVPNVDLAGPQARGLQEKMHWLAGAIDLASLAAGIEELASIVVTFCPPMVKSQTAAVVTRMHNLFDVLNDPRVP